MNDGKYKILSSLFIYFYLFYPIYLFYYLNNSDGGLDYYTLSQLWFELILPLLSLIFTLLYFRFRSNIIAPIAILVITLVFQLLTIYAVFYFFKTKEEISKDTIPISIACTGVMLTFLILVRHILMIPKRKK